ncbi:MAG TPA: hypothetical protein VKH64_02970 [Candidatus Binatia bacterium]|nr:hypothetical protein [Candidatus Binatia bacterium]
MNRTKTPFVAIALCLFLTGCYVVRHGGQENPYTDGQIHYYYLKYDFYYYPDAGHGRWHDEESFGMTSRAS